MNDNTIGVIGVGLLGSALAERCLVGNMAVLGFEARLSQHLKDVRLILAAGQRGGAHLPFSSLHGKLLEQLESQGFGDSDNSAVIKAFA